MGECAKIKRMLSRYLDKEVSDADSVAIEAHLVNCPLCKKEISELYQVKSFASKIERKTLSQDYMVSRLRDAIAYAQYAKKKLSLAGMGNFARKLIPVPVTAIVISILFLIFTSTQPVAQTSFEDHIFSGNAATMEIALELILGS
jgi:predicted anti-sigma-YlaC factor YlaD